jgi:hypothetical protein
LRTVEHKHIFSKAAVAEVMRRASYLSVDFRRTLVSLDKEIVMSGCRRSLPGLLLIATLSLSNPTRAAAVVPTFATQYAGYQISNEFTIDPQRHGVISPPTGAVTGDLLWIRPLRLNGDEYLVLQRCNSPDCSDAQVLRAWNALGSMGPLPILSNKVPMEAGATYLIWMQRISVKGGDTFPLFQRDGPALVFAPAGPARIFAAADLKGALKRGPTKIARTSKESGAFVVKFEGGSVVRMEMLRAESDTSTR